MTPPWKKVEGPSTSRQVHPVGKLSDYEATRLKEVNEQLEGEIAKGLESRKTARMRFALR